MAIVFSEGVIEVAVHALVGTKPHVNVWHMASEEGWGTGDVDAVLDFRDNWQDHILDMLTTQYFLQRFEWRSLDPDDNNVGTVLPNAAKPTTGASSAEAHPPNVAMLIHKNTAHRPRGRRDGRCFLSGIPEGTTNAAGTLAAGTITFSNTTLAAFYNGVTDYDIVTGTGKYLCVLETTEASREKGNDHVTIGKRRVTSLTVDPLVATQRDRLR